MEYNIQMGAGSAVLACSTGYTGHLQGGILKTNKNKD